MAKKIIWTPQAEETFEGILNYLEINWTEKEKRNFIVATDKIIQLISKQPDLFRKSNSLNTYEALVTKHNLLLYIVKKDTVDLITFWDTRRNPKKKHKNK